MSPRPGSSSGLAATLLGIRAHGRTASGSRPARRGPTAGRPGLGGGDAPILRLPGGRRICWRAVALDAHRIAAIAGRPVEVLTRRDVAPALLGMPPADAGGAARGLRG